MIVTSISKSIRPKAIQSPRPMASNPVDTRYPALKHKSTLFGHVTTYSQCFVLARVRLVLEWARLKNAGIDRLSPRVRQPSRKVLATIGRAGPSPDSAHVQTYSPLLEF
jgi:hypothetical protein